MRVFSCSIIPNLIYELYVDDGEEYGAQAESTCYDAKCCGTFLSEPGCKAGEGWVEEHGGANGTADRWLGRG